MKQRKSERKVHIAALAVCVIFAVALLFFLVVTVVHHIRGGRAQTVQSEDAVLDEKYIADWPDMQVELLDINEYSRPQIALEKVNGIVIHYTANPGTTA